MSEATDSDLYQDVIHDLATASELIDWLDRGHEQWSGDPFNWLFRGQKCRNWHLSPSAWRQLDETRLLRDNNWEPPGDTSRQQCQSEYELARRFFRLADAQGLPIPGDSTELRRMMEGSNPPTGANGSWPPQDFVWLLTIAQHYGIPTRLIDWTRKPLIAAWFAAEQAAKEWHLKKEKDQAFEKRRIVVWAVRRRLGPGNADGDAKDVLSATDWMLTSAPRAAVPNLHLQSGMLTYREVHEDAFDNPKDVTPMCESIIRYCKDASNNAPLENHLKAASIPWAESGKLLKLLRDRFVQATTVYAGYRGVAQSVTEHRWRSDPLR